MSYCLLLTYILFVLPLQQQPDAAAQFNRAVQLQQQGRFAEAADAYRALLEHAPEHTDALANYGATLSRLGRHDESVAAYSKALLLAPQRVEILFNLGIAHYRAGDFSQAAETFKRFLEQRPEVVAARQLYGLSLVEIGRDRDAIVQLGLTLEAAPREVSVLYSLGLAHLRLRQKEADQMIERLSAFPAGVAAAHLLRGQTLIAGGEFEKALAELESAARLDANLPRLHYSIGLAYHQLGRNPEALEAFEKDLAVRPGDFLTLYYVALLQESAGDLDAAERHLSAALKLAPESPDAMALHAKLLFKRGRAAEAVAPLEFAIKQNPTDTERRYLLARIYQQLGRREDAAREFAEVQRLKAKQLEDDRARTPKP
ncbi:MAG: tetratricopeptide repeat protein [Blastocatellales bacterium]|nr:tetratricopeptide repeat protein [Blastocatellales bacterium]